MSLIIHFLNGNNTKIENHYFEKEYRNDIIVESNGKYYEVYFFTQDALTYEMTIEGYFGLPGLIILDQITTDKIKKSIFELERKGFFKRFSGMGQLNQEVRFIHNWYVNKLSLSNMNDMISEELV